METQDIGDVLFCQFGSPMITTSAPSKNSTCMEQIFSSRAPLKIFETVICALAILMINLSATIRIKRLKHQAVDSDFYVCAAEPERYNWVAVRKKMLEYLAGSRPFCGTLPHNSAMRGNEVIRKPKGGDPYFCIHVHILQHYGLNAHVS